MAKKLDGGNLNQEEAEETKDGVVSKIVERLPEVDPSKDDDAKNPETTKKVETEDDDAAAAGEETNKGDEEVVITADENVVVTEEIAEAFGLEEGYIGKTVTFTEEEIAAAESKLSEDATESVGDTEITEELAKTLGLPKTFIGKPLSEAGKSYKEAVKWENENNKQIKNLQKTVEDLVSKLSDGDISQIEKEANAEAAETVPDPVTEPDKFAEWLKTRDDLIMQKVLAKVNDNPSIKAAEEVAAKNMETDTVKAVQAGLPEGIKAGEVMDSWFEENKEDYEDMVKTGMYKNKPQKLVKDILNWYKASSYDSLKNKKESDVKKQVHKKTVENLKAKGNKTKTNFSSNPRGEATKTDSAVSRILKNLEEQNALKTSPN